MSKELESALDTIKTAIENDEDYKQSWQANLAMSFYDSIPETLDVGDDLILYANEGASRFLKKLFDVDSEWCGKNNFLKRKGEK